MTTTMETHERWMREAIAEARKAASAGEVPVGAVAVSGDGIVARAHNVREATHDPLGHAELLLLEKISRELRSWRLERITIYVTCEPCLMCSGALLQARVPRVVYGCADAKAGAMGSLYHVHDDARLNHRIEVIHSVLAEECGQLLTDFFRDRRKGKKG